MRALFILCWLLVQFLKWAVVCVIAMAVLGVVLVVALTREAKRLTT